MDERPSRRRAISALLAGVLAVAGLLALTPPATAAGGPIVAGLSITPSTTKVGTGVTVVGSATNTTSSTQMVSMGVDIPTNVTSTSVSGSKGCTPRHLTKLIYCGVGVSPGATATITFTATPKVSGTFNFRSYARITYTTDDTFAYASLTTS